MKKISLLLSGIILFLCGFAQPNEQHSSRPKVGELMPDFVLENITHYKAERATLKDFKGKWLFMDFWFKNCIGCIKSFPKISKLQKQFADKIQFMMVASVDDSPGSWQQTQSTKETFEALTIKHELDLPCVYDSILPKKWNIYSMPYIIVVDPNGIVKAITANLTESNILSLINKGNADLYIPASERTPSKIGIDHENPLPTDSLVLYQSTLAKFNYEAYDKGFYPLDYQDKDSKFLRKGYQLFEVPLYRLYNLAYFSEALWNRNHRFYQNIYPTPVLEIKSDSLFKWQDLNNYKKGLYNYKISMPVGSEITKERIMELMQGDLKKYFGYEVEIEKRKMPYYSLIALPGALARLQNVGASKKMEYKAMGTFGFKAIRFPPRDLLGLIIAYFTERYTMPFLDETGISSAIDLNMEVDMSNMDLVRNELRKNKLDLVLRHKEFIVMVLRDPKPVKYITEATFSPHLKRLTKLDTININRIIMQHVNLDRSPNWIELSEKLQEFYPEIADEIVLKTKVEYNLSIDDIKKFETAIIAYSTRFFFSMQKEKLIQYAEFLSKKSTNEDILDLADRWRSKYLDNDNAHSWYVSASILYKLGILMKTNEKGPNIAGGELKVKGGINYMKMAVKIDPNNKVYQKVLTKMEKGEPTW